MTPYASSAFTIAEGPQPPFLLSRRLSHSPIRPASSSWKALVSGALSCMASTICVPATAHRSLSASLMKAVSGSSRRSTSTATRGGIAVGVGAGGGVWPGARDTVGVGATDVGRGRGPWGHQHGLVDGPVGRRVDEELDPAGQVLRPVPDPEQVQPDRGDAHEDGREQDDDDRAAGDPASAVGMHGADVLRAVRPR